jgi:hypothetical protein
MTDNDINNGILPDGFVGLERAALAAEKLNADNARGCVRCDGEFRVNIEGENLCQHHADEWVRGEGMAANEVAQDEGRL